jgi:hypothetical protein
MIDKKSILVGLVFAVSGFIVQCFGMFAYRLDIFWTLLSPYDRTPLLLMIVFCGSLFVVGYIVGFLQQFEEQP